jgi:sporulation protein YlmC with PRC-barrel domain
MSYPNLSPGARLLKVKLRDAEGRELGQVKEWMMDIDEGKVVYVLASFNSAPDKYFALPWKMMEADKENGGYRIRIKEDQAKAAPQLEAASLDSVVGDKNFLDKVYEHFEVEAYWNAGTGSSAGQATENTKHGEDRGYGNPSPS